MYSAYSFYLTFKIIRNLYLSETIIPLNIIIIRMMIGIIADIINQHLYYLTPLVSVIIVCFCSSFFVSCLVSILSPYNNSYIIFFCMSRVFNCAMTEDFKLLYTISLHKFILFTDLTNSFVPFLYPI